jgi:hypothetical protein
MKTPYLFGLYGIWVLSLSACCLPSKHSSRSSEAIYQSDRASAVEVFDLAGSRMFSALPQYIATRDKEYVLGERGGRIAACSNDDFLCLEGGINIAIPRYPSGQTSWQFAGRACSSRDPLGGVAAVEISCRFKNYVTDFVFDLQRGVVRYRWHRNPSNEYGGGPNGEFTLVGGKGLFAESIGQPMEGSVTKSQNRGSDPGDRR